MKPYTPKKHGKFKIDDTSARHTEGQNLTVPDKTQYCQSSRRAKELLRNANRSMKKAARQSAKRELRDLQ